MDCTVQSPLSCKCDLFYVVGFVCHCCGVAETAYNSVCIDCTEDVAGLLLMSSAILNFVLLSCRF